MLDARSPEPEMHDTELLDLLNHDIDHAQRLLELIDSEFKALTERDLPQLEQILSDKQPLLALLDQHGRLRAEALQALGLSIDRAGLTALAERSPVGADLLARSARLSDVLEQCQAGNLRNGRLIRASQTSVDNTLAILRGQETPSLYDSRGGAAKIPRQRPLSQA